MNSDLWLNVAGGVLALFISIPLAFIVGHFQVKAQRKKFEQELLLKKLEKGYD